MALSLSAEQKSVNDLFEKSERFVIPDFQRAYSWDYAICMQMYSDITQAFDRKEDYFLGNILLARSDDEPKQPRVIDGQQRLITLWLVLKCLSIILPDYHALPGLLRVSSSLRDKTLVTKIQSLVFEATDQKIIEDVDRMGRDELEKLRCKVCEEKHRVEGIGEDNRVLVNVAYIYRWFYDYAQRSMEELNTFCDYLLEHVFLLPIEIVGESVDDSMSRTLIIFETLNNRGLDLTDADIFKSRLYAKAKIQNKEKEFIDKWVNLNDDCSSLHVSIDDVFRYYSHILRGRAGISTSEMKLRDFFVSTKNAPLTIKPVDEIMDDLCKIVDIIRYIDTSRKMEDEGAVWMQIFDMYTNVFPFYALVVYLFINGTQDRKSFVFFLKNLVRYCYAYGSSSSIKFGIYSIIKQITNERYYSYVSDIKVDALRYTGRLQKGFALLLYYLKNPNHILMSYSIVKIFRKSDNITSICDGTDADMDMIDASVTNMQVRGYYRYRNNVHIAEDTIGDRPVDTQDIPTNYDAFCVQNEKNMDILLAFFKDITGYE